MYVERNSMKIFQKQDVVMWLPASRVVSSIPSPPHESTDLPVPDPVRLGQKGAGLLRMAALGLPVPPFLILPATLWPEFVRQNRLPDAVWEQIFAQLAVMGQRENAVFGDPQRPLLLSVRSGSEVSMPGMLDTLLNVGLTSAAIPGLGKRLGDVRCAFDCRRRFLHKYATSVLGLSSGSARLPDPLLSLFLSFKQRRGAGHDLELSVTDLEVLCGEYEREILARTGQTVPEDAFVQLREAVYAVLRSFFSPRAQEYRRLQNISGEVGTAVTLQAMVFGNVGPDSATGVVFSRDPRTGERGLCGEFLPTSQGDDLVSGGTIPLPIAELKTVLPAAHLELERAAQTLEQHLGDLQDIEFTVEQGQLFLLQTRSGKRSARAMVRIARDLLHDGCITEPQALLRMEPRRLAELFLPTVNAKTQAIVRGLPASPGAVLGPVVFSSQDAIEHRQQGRGAILIRTETSTEDIAGIEAATGLVTTRGGITSHAAVIARGLGRCAVVGCSSLRVDKDHAETREHTLRKGDVVTLDGHRGLLFPGTQPLSLSHVSADPDLTWLLAASRKAAHVPVWSHVQTEAEAVLAEELTAVPCLLADATELDEPRPFRFLLPTSEPPGLLVPVSHFDRLPDLVLQHPLIALCLRDIPVEETLAQHLALVGSTASGTSLRIGFFLDDALTQKACLFAMALRLHLHFVASPVRRTPVAWLQSARESLHIDTAAS